MKVNRIIKAFGNQRGLAKVLKASDATITRFKRKDADLPIKYIDLLLVGMRSKMKELKALEKELVEMKRILFK